MIVDAIDSFEGLLKLEPEWRRLQDEVGSLPFTSWEWNVTWWRHLSRRSLGRADRLFVRTLRSGSGELVGVAPLMLTAYPARATRFRCLQYFGADPNLTEIRSALYRPELEEEVHEALFEDLFAHDREWDCCIVDGVRGDGRVVPLLQRRADTRWMIGIPDYVLALPSDWEEFRSTRSRNIKESLRKCSNSLKRHGLRATHHVATSGPELETALDAFFLLHTARAEQNRTVRHRDVFKSAPARRFLRELCDRYSAVDGVRVFSMEVEGRAVAARLAFRAGRSLYLYYSGFDPAYARYSVMTSVVAEAIKYAIAHGYETVNLSTGNDVSKRRWSPSQTIFQQAFVPSSTLRARVATVGFCHLRKLRQAWSPRMDRLALAWARTWANESEAFRRGSPAGPSSLPPR